ncbi:NAD(P)-binding domain-containing protein [Paraburkholderia sp. Tr-20389]|uniref:NAD(P)-binding domain-containing protein n=1 Tax=Paraburkholderia sp. Tr-20389 TaxID=2703903 RepID=UPI00197DD6EF|nr:NAD(P)-binding domain-containing protein [Paraburkholderia sp. Tr-20389]MBN3755278.1 NAD(P)-binding domain-containing protein [Paraburkholderia sp. Tr-20389]
MIKLGVLGVGDLTDKMIRGLSRDGSAAIQLLLSPRNEGKAAALAKDLDCMVMASNQDVVNDADVVLVGVRPAHLAELARQVTLKPLQPLISVVAGVSIEDLSRLFGNRDYSRVMMSYAAEINRSTVAVHPANSKGAQLFAPLGNVVNLETEREFELAMIAACMNGWFYFLIHELQQWLTQNGMPPEAARALVFSSVEDCVAYSRYKSSTPIDELGLSIATPGTYTAGGRDLLIENGGYAAWKAACDHVFNQLAPDKS